MTTKICLSNRKNTTNFIIGVKIDLAIKHKITLDNIKIKSITIKYDKETNPWLEQIEIDYELKK